MEIEYRGANCFVINTKKARLVFDDNLSEVGLKTVTKNGDIVFFGASHKEPTVETLLIIDQPGEYEVSNVSVNGIAARSATDEADKTSATMYKLIIDDIRVAVVGHIYPELNDSQLEALGTVDVLLIPVGGNGYTLDPVGAQKVAKKIAPKLVIPSHYADSAVKYEVPQQTLEEALKGLALEPRERVAKLKLKASELLNEDTQLIVLERQ